MSFSSKVCDLKAQKKFRFQNSSTVSVSWKSKIIEHQYESYQLVPSIIIIGTTRPLCIVFETGRWCIWTSDAPTTPKPGCCFWALSNASENTDTISKFAYALSRIHLEFQIMHLNFRLCISNFRPCIWTSEYVSEFSDHASERWDMYLSFQIMPLNFRTCIWVFR